MKKLFFQGFLVVILFFSVWYGLSRINWLQMVNLQEVTDLTEDKLGKLYWDFFRSMDGEITDSIVVQTLDSIFSVVCTPNEINQNEIQLHVLQNDEVNAFALPGNYLIIYSGLILEAENPSELAGVISHELAHIELHHVMHKLIKEAGLSVLLSMSSGNAGSATIQETARILSSSAYDRGLEREADQQAVEYLVNAGISPEPFANFLYRISLEEPAVLKRLSWLNTHPDTEERATDIIEYGGSMSRDEKTFLSDKDWEMVQTQVKEE